MYSRADHATNVDSMLASDAFSRWLGIRVVSLDEGACELTATVRAEMVNGFGIAHGGIAFALADSAMAFASNHGEHVFVALCNSVTYSKPLHLGDRVTAIANVVTQTGKTATYDVSLTVDESGPAAVFRGIVYRTSGFHRK